MKNLINYYYNFESYDIVYNNSKYYFKNKGENYILKLCYDQNIGDYYKYLGYQLRNLNNNYFFKIIPNRNNTLITIIENKPYVLLKTSNINNDEISIFDLKTNAYINNNQLLSIIDRSDWINMWTNKIDYFEEWFNDKKEKYNDLYAIYNFYIGLSENALLYLKENKNKTYKRQNDRLCIQHKRINKNSKLYDYYDISEVILDHPTRDIAEYIKSCMTDDTLDITVLENYLDNTDFSEYGLKIMYARILFPTFFYDYIDNMILNNGDANLSVLESKTVNYYKNIKKISMFFKQKYGIPTIL